MYRVFGPRFGKTLVTTKLLVTRKSSNGIRAERSCVYTNYRVFAVTSCVKNSVRSIAACSVLMERC